MSADKNAVRGFPFLLCEPSRRMHPSPRSTRAHASVRTSDRILHAVSNAIVTASEGPGSSCATIARNPSRPIDARQGPPNGPTWLSSPNIERTESR